MIRRNMRRIDAYSMIRGHTDRMSTRINNVLYQTYHDQLRIRWTHMIDNVCYVRLPASCATAEKLLLKSDICPVCGQPWPTSNGD